MIQTNTKTAEQLQREAMDANDKATNRILGALAAAPEHRYDTRSEAHAALSALPGVYAVEVSHRERTVFRRGFCESKFTWTVSAIHSDNKANLHIEQGMSLHTCVCRVLESYRLNPLGTDAMEELESIGLARPSKRSITAPEDVVDSVAAPLTSIGPSGIGGEYQKETCGNCGREKGMHISVGGGRYRCCTEAEAKKYARDIAEE